MSPVDTSSHSDTSSLSASESDETSDDDSIKFDTIKVKGLVHEEFLMREVKMNENLENGIHPHPLSHFGVALSQILHDYMAKHITDNQTHEIPDFCLKTANCT